MRLAERSNAASFVGSEDRIKTSSFHALEIWQFINILLSALVTGVFWGTWLGLVRSMASLTPETFLAVGHAMIGNLGTIMAILMPAALLATLPVLFLLSGNHHLVTHSPGHGCTDPYGSHRSLV